LQHGAARVTAVDTGFGQIAMKLRNDPRVRLLERTNARFLAPGALAVQAAEKLETEGGRGPQRRAFVAGVEEGGFNPRRMLAETTRASAPEGLTLLVMDVSFISATLLLGPVLAAAPGLAEAVVLVKPQFEAGREHVGKGGIVRDPEAHQLAIGRVACCLRALNWQVIESIPSPITGMEGNREFLLYARRS
jgi:23S rRNA (cytidine1920-2'-O)/16S rRNA (cytidine1409-2'-O)-methyltransferase